MAYADEELAREIGARVERFVRDVVAGYERDPRLEEHGPARGSSQSPQVIEEPLCSQNWLVRPVNAGQADLLHATELTPHRSSEQRPQVRPMVSRMSSPIDVSSAAMK